MAIDKDTIRKYEWILIPLVLVVAAFFGGDYYGQRKVEKSLVSERDTVIRTVTVYKDFPDPKESALAGFVPVPTYKFITDTVTREKLAVLHDTTVVYLPREQAYYEEEEGRLRMWVSGYEPRLDRYELDAQTITITNTVTEKASRWGLSISGGYGAVLVDRTVRLSPYIGLGISYTFLRF